MGKRKIVIFASGSGSNAQRIIEYFRQQQTAEITAVFCNNPQAYVQERCKQLQVPFVLFTREQFKEQAVFLSLLEPYQPDLIVLAGFLWLIPSYLVKSYPARILNIHPALLPAYGGKGMYGQHVHEAVIHNQEKESGISIHLVNEEYDKGAILFQAKTPVTSTDTASSLASRIHELEHKHFPQVIDQYLQNTIFEQ